MVRVSRLIFTISHSFVIIHLTTYIHSGRFHRRLRWSNTKKKHVGWYTGPSLANIEMETIKEDVFILGLDARLSHGLDLSFCTHLYLLEPIDDAALLEQVRDSSQQHSALTLHTFLCTNLSHTYYLPLQSGYVSCSSAWSNWTCLYRNRQRLA